MQDKSLFLKPYICRVKVPPNIRPYLAILLLGLQVLATVPPGTWHHCEHDTHDTSHLGEPVFTEDHQCELCDFHFSGSYLIQSETRGSSRTEHSSVTILYQAPEATNLQSPSIPRGPPYAV